MNRPELPENDDANARDAAKTAERRECGPVTVSRIAPEEWAVLRALRLRALADAPYAFSSTYEGMAAKPETYWRDMAQRRANSDDDCTFLARAGDEATGAPIGMAGGYRDPNDRDLVHVIAVWVAPDARGTGVAERLIETVCAWAAGIPVCIVGAYVSDGNHRARRFYERVGFKPAPPDAPRPGAHASDDSVLLLRPLTR